MASLQEVEAYNYLRARSPVGLRSLIRKHELRTGRRFKYQFYFAAGYHYAWYIGSETIKQTKEQIIEELKDKASKDK